MINYDTIISNFDDKVTLYNWLRKVEEALKNASATNFVVNKKGNATLSFSIAFADGETLESGDIVLQQGESVDQARIASGILQLHLTNGTWLTAGNIKPVNDFNIDANQHLIVNYQDGTSQDLGAIFNGNVNIVGTLNATKVTGDEIVENMSGYTFTPSADLSKNGITLTYAGAVKNGNKVTFVIAGLFNNTTGLSITPHPDLGNFTVPINIGQKLYPMIGTTIDVKPISFFLNYNTIVQKNMQMRKNNNTTLNFQLISMNKDFNADADYAFRIEETFLLSDNLAQ